MSFPQDPPRGSQSQERNAWTSVASWACQRPLLGLSPPRFLAFWVWENSSGRWQLFFHTKNNKAKVTRHGMASSLFCETPTADCYHWAHMPPGYPFKQAGGGFLQLYRKCSITQVTTASPCSVGSDTFGDPLSKGKQNYKYVARYKCDYLFWWRKENTSYWTLRGSHVIIYQTGLYRIASQLQTVFLSHVQLLRCIGSRRRF